MNWQDVSKNCLIISIRKMMSCNFCHGWKELDFHPLLYKISLCSDGCNCDKKDCTNYHNLNEKKIVDELRL